MSTSRPHTAAAEHLGDDRDPDRLVEAGGGSVTSAAASTAADFEEFRFNAVAVAEQLGPEICRAKEVAQRVQPSPLRTTMLALAKALRDVDPIDALRQGGLNGFRPVWLDLLALEDARRLLEFRAGLIKPPLNDHRRPRGALVRMVMARRTTRQRGATVLCARRASRPRGTRTRRSSSQRRASVRAGPGDDPHSAEGDGDPPGNLLRDVDDHLRRLSPDGAEREWLVDQIAYLGYTPERVGSALVLAVCNGRARRGRGQNDADTIWAVQS